MALTPEEEAQIQIDEPDVPGAPDEADGPITSPGQVDPAFLAAVDSVPHPDPSLRLSPEEESQIQIDSPSSSRSVKVAGRGFGPDTGQGQIWQKGYEQFAENDRRLADNRNTDLEQSRAAYGQAGGALEHQGDIEGEKSRAEAELLQHKENFLRESADLDQHMYQQAQTESQQYLNSYRQQIAAVRQMTVTNPVQSLSGLQSGGLSLAMFAQGFLAAQGIHIDVQGQVDRWVDRSIHEQERQIGQAEAGAEDQLNLWKIAQETSRNDMEARQRYRGMVLQAMQTAVDINAARFAAPLAQSAAEVAKAKLGIEQTSTEQAIRSNYEKERLANLKAMRDEAHMKVEERFRSWQLAIADRAEKAKAAKAAKEARPIGVTDPEHPVGYQGVLRAVAGPDGKPITLNGKVIPLPDVQRVDDTRWVYDPKEDATLGKYIRESRSKWANRMDLAGETLKLYDAAKTDFDASKSKWAGLSADKQWEMASRYSPAIRTYMQARTNLLNAMIYDASGKAINESEFKRWSGTIPLDKIFQDGTTGELLIRAREVSRREFERDMQSPGIIDTKKGQPVSPTSAAMYKVVDQGDAPTSDPVDRVSGRVLSKDTEDRNLSVSGLYTQQADTRAAKYGEPEWATNIDTLVHAAADPYSFVATAAAKGLGGGNPKELQAKAVERLQFFADNAPGSISKYARMGLEMLKSDPAKAKALVTSSTESPGATVKDSFDEALSLPPQLFAPQE